jgi:hypothetical protein
MTPDSEAHQTYIATLKEKYKTALVDEHTALESLDGARRRKEIYASTLKEEGIDPRIVENTVSTYRIKLGGTATHLFAYPVSNGNGVPETPLSDTHAVYIAIRKHGNTGMTFGEVAKLSTELGYELTAEQVKKAFWKQQNEKRMRREGEKVFLTKEGEAFTKFRVQKHGG